MSHIVSLHSYRGGTGKSNLAANLAYLAARRGRRVAVIDTDLESPGVHMVLGLPRERITHTLTDYLFGRSELEEAAYDLSSDLGLRDGSGELYLLPSSMTVEAIVRILSDGYDASRLNDHLTSLMDGLKLDLLMIDTHPGLNRQTMLTTAISNALVVVLRPDTQDFHGTAVLMEVADRLGVPRTYMLLNKVPRSLDPDDVQTKVEEAFGHRVIANLPFAEELAVLGSRGLFVIESPDHPVTYELNKTIDRLLSDLASDGPQGR